MCQYQLKMSGKFRGRYRISSTRAPWWDYGNDAAYFVTVCAKNKRHYFGEIIGDFMHKSPVGEIAENHWKEIPGRFKYIRLGKFVVMPNHIHGIIIINKENDSSNKNFINKDFLKVETRLIASLLSKNQISGTDIPSENSIYGKEGYSKNQMFESQSGSFPDKKLEYLPQSSPTANRGGVTGIHNPMLHQNLSRAMRWFTGRVSYEVHKTNPDFSWQGRFHDHIIRNMKEFKSATFYILSNPMNWKDDQFY